MLKELTLNTTVYLVTGYSDLRKGIEGLAAVVQGSLSLDPFQGTVSVLRSPSGSDQGTLMGGRRISSPLQTFGQRRVPLASE